MRHVDGSVYVTPADGSGADFVPRTVESKNVVCGKACCCLLIYPVTVFMLTARLLPCQRKDRALKKGGTITEQEDQAYLEKLARDLAAKKLGASRPSSFVHKVDFH